MGDHVPQLRFPGAELLDDRADIVGGDFDTQQFHRLEQLSVLIALVDDLRAGDSEFVTLAPHRFDEDGEVQLAAPGDFERIRRFGFFHAHRHVRFHFLEEAVADVARCDIFAFSARERGVVDDEVHGDGGLVDLDELEGLHTVDVAGGLADVDVRDAGDADDLAGAGLGNFLPAEALEHIELRDFDLFFAAVVLAEDDLLALLDSTAFDAPDAHAADIVVVVQGGEQHLQRRVHIALRGRDFFQDALENRPHIAFAVALVIGSVTVAGGRVHHREFDLVLVGAEFDEQVDDLVYDFGRTRAGPVDLVDDDHDFLLQAKRFLQDEACLGHAALERIDEQQHAVDHEEDALHFAAEIGVAGGIDDVDLRVAVAHGGVFGQNGDAALPLEVVRVHDPLVDLLVLAENAALLEQRVDQRRLAVVDMGDHRHISDVFAKFQGFTFN